MFMKSKKSKGSKYFD